MFYALWSPFTFLMGYNDPRKPTDDLLHGMLLPMPMLQQCSSKLSTSKQQCTCVGCGLADTRHDISHACIHMTGGKLGASYIGAAEMCVMRAALLPSRVVYPNLFGQPLA